jgi:hypothetical protein
VRGESLDDPDGRERTERALDAIRDGTAKAIGDPGPALAAITDASKSDAALIRAEWDAIRNAVEPAVRLDRDALHGWAQFDARFGILERPPVVGDAFDLSLAAE